MSITSAGWWIAASLFTGALPASAQADPNAEKLRGLGRAMHQDLVSRSKPFDDPAVQSYVAGIGTRLVQQLSAPGYEYRFELLVTNVATEPVAFHEGAVVIPASFLARVDNEADMLIAIAHAIAHTELPTPVLQRNPSTANIVMWFPYCHTDCDTRMVIPIAMRPKWRGIEDEASRFATDLVERAAMTPDTEAFNNIRKIVRGLLGTPGQRRPPSLYR